MTFGATAGVKFGGRQPSIEDVAWNGERSERIVRRFFLVASHSASDDFLSSAKRGT
ncbi:MAG TPA: hypothetical protein VJ762_13650 [Sphingobium sp.]|nr:hypothetical protein [Sphingobium sp.]